MANCANDGPLRTFDHVHLASRNQLLHSPKSANGLQFRTAIVNARDRALRRRFMAALRIETAGRRTIPHVRCCVFCFCLFVFLKRYVEEHVEQMKMISDTKMKTSNTRSHTIATIDGNMATTETTGGTTIRAQMDDANNEQR